jgi:hypothetical protein
LCLPEILFIFWAETVIKSHNRQGGGGFVSEDSWAEGRRNERDYRIDEARARE